MCRLFGMSGGREPVRASFWLLEAPDSLLVQSRANPDGFGLGTFEEDGGPDVDKRPVAAWNDDCFTREANEEVSRVFVAHVRHASMGDLSMENTHPFEQRGRLFAHNGVIRGLDELEAELGEEYRALVRGDTDSERFFALVTKRIDAAGGDVRAGIADAVGWAAANLPLYSLNFVLATADELWALRYPSGNELFLLERAPGGRSGRRRLDASSEEGMRVRSDPCATRAIALLASERLDEDPDWRLLEPGSLAHIGPDLQVTVETVADAPPERPLSLDELAPVEAESQAAGAGSAAA